MKNVKIARFFSNTWAFIRGNPDLRDPQVEGWFRTRQPFRNSSEHAILQIPVGCGTTEPLANVITQARCPTRRFEYLASLLDPMPEKRDAEVVPVLPVGAMVQMNVITNKPDGVTS